MSTLDVTGKGRFTLVTGLSGTAWQAAVAALALPFLDCLVTGAPGSADPYCAWQAAREIDEAGALLVRPDGYIAWRQPEAVADADTARRQLAEALSQVLDRSV